MQTSTILQYSFLLDCVFLNVINCTIYNEWIWVSLNLSPWFLLYFPGFGLPDEVVIEKKGKGDSFIESTGADVRLSNIKFIQHDAIEGIVCGYTSTCSLANLTFICTNMFKTL